jgi:hypothetical protein
MLALLIAAVPAAALAASIVVGGVPLTIPNPAGFVPLTPQMKATYELQRQSVPASVEQFGVYLPESEARNAITDDPDLNLNRRFSIGAAKRLIDTSLKSADFSQFKQIVKTQNAELVRKAEQAMPGLMENVNSYIKQKAGIEQAVAVVGLMALPPHDETDRSISFSLFEKTNTIDRTVGIATTTYLYVKGKILILHCLADEEGLDWSRIALKKWTDAVLAANAT